MRLIDADALMEQMGEPHPLDYNGQRDYSLVKDAPTVDAVPVRHGHWKVSKDNYFNKCSECGALYDIALTENIFTNYCPRCGAKMDGADGERRE